MLSHISNVFNYSNFNKLHQQNNNTNNIKFGNRQLTTDILELSNDKLEKTNKTNDVKKVKIKDLNNNIVNAEIIKSGDKLVKRFDLLVNNENLGFAVASKGNDNTFWLHQLFTRENDKRSYKGTGTELLKCVIEESKKQGFDGAVKVFADHGTKSPLVFYYKSNFITPEDKDACIQYAIRNNVPIQNVMSTSLSGIMTLDEKSADAFLEGTRLYLNRTCKKIGEKEIDGQIYSANLIEAPQKNTYYLLIANEDVKEGIATFSATLKKVENEGKNHFEITKLHEYDSYNLKEEINFILNSIKKEAKTIGFEKITIANDLDIKTKNIIKKYKKITGSSSAN